MHPFAVAGFTWLAMSYPLQAWMIRNHWPPGGVPPTEAEKADLALGFVFSPITIITATLKVVSVHIPEHVLAGLYDVLFSDPEAQLELKD